MASTATASIPVRELLSPRHGDSWTHTRAGEPRAYIEARQLRELWIHTGTACNLSCPFCLEGSRPGDDRMQRMSLEDVKPFIDEAVSLGVEQFSFTGGEPFVVRDFVRILDYASQHKPCFVLTNGTDVLRQRGHQLAPLRDNAHPISFRVSIDYPDVARHDAGRGEGSFLQSMAGIRWLLDQGFEVSIARQSDTDEDAEAVAAAMRALLRAHDVPGSLPCTVFPDLGTPGSDNGSPEVTVSCMDKYPTAQSRAHFMCSYSRMLVKQRGQVGVYACTLVDDDPDYDLGSTLAQSLQPRVMLRHPRCYSCYRFGASCSAP